ncbi:hypothetical protein EMPS_03913 [Entomortierella parvispora]|uniref:Uncharacterized protein n=1 Tax=Entomortierella parvispora TaxID=205924 RepID=A0A9P3H851_9FUNG|nr:hypothetical protein EMPS_03913 [Entomortierella parvispora]
MAPKRNPSQHAASGTLSTEQTVRLKHYRNIFEDPKDVDSLQSGRVLSVEDSIREADLAIEMPAIRSKRYCGLKAIPNGGNQRRIFLTVQFLIQRLHQFCANAKDELRDMSLTRGGELYTQLSAELERAEPSLRGVTAGALYSTVGRLCADYNAYEKLATSATGVDLAFSTRLLELCRLLRDYDRTLLRIKQETSELTAEERARVAVAETATRQNLITEDRRRRMHKKLRFDDTVSRCSSEDIDNDDEQEGEEEENEDEDGHSASEQYDSETQSSDGADVTHVRAGVALPVHQQQQERLYPPSILSTMVPSPKHRSMTPPRSTKTTKTMRMPRGFAKEQRRIADEVQSIRQVVAIETTARIKELSWNMTDNTTIVEDLGRNTVAKIDDLNRNIDDLNRNIDDLNRNTIAVISMLSDLRSEMHGTFLTFRNEIRDLQDIVWKSYLRTSGPSPPQPHSASVRWPPMLARSQTTLHPDISLATAAAPRPPER